MSKVRELRQKYGYTQDYMAERMGLRSKNAYSLKERGERKFSLDEANIISLIFELPIEQIFFENEVTKKITK
ncbi:helix-turn-helix domain-containing protein [Acetobacterium malicum]|uniref:Helix-turn-helix domain-containing protein n=1 Tax=Acetobacterium malicum TaxID=52692 RepID=A0ABR6Z213_9FIRM|nr:helix-turn-helix domain-containing protein [Acetobacterium malicum]MBC3901563.1 helix-turn-helix domain-containing protein [Acetobacterium malicum]